MLLISLFIIIIYSSFNNNKTNHLSIYNYDTKNINRIGILIIIYTIYILIDSNINTLIGINSISIYNDIYKINILSQIISIIILILSVILLFNSISTNLNIKDIDIINYNNKNYIIIVIFNLIGLLLFINVNNLIALYITIELQSYSLYILTSLYNKSNNALKSGLLYFLIGGIASIFILYGTAIIYYITGCLYLDYIYILINYNNSIYIGLIMIIIGFILKMGMAPLHNWSINIYNNTPTIITMWISICAKLSILTLLFYIIYNINIYNNNNNYIIYILSIFTILSLIIGSIGGLMQIKLKILLTYSGILNGGYLLFTILINNINSLVAFIIYLLQYTITHVNLFIIILFIPSIIYNNYYNKSNNNNNNLYTSIYSPIEYINQLYLLIKINPFINLSLIISLFSLIGIPPLFGFYGKLLIIISGLSYNYIYITLLLIICSTISTLYYIYIIKESSIYKNINDDDNNNNINNNKSYNYIYNNSINGNSITYIISILSLIILLNGVQIINIIKGAFIISISLINII